MARQGPIEFTDIWLIYESREHEGMWVAHSINTDQVGMGRSIVDAYVALYRAMEALKEEIAGDPSISPLRPAPKEVRDLLAHARRLPREIEQIAAIKMRGRRAPKPKPPRYKIFQTHHELMAG